MPRLHTFVLRIVRSFSTKCFYFEIQLLIKMFCLSTKAFSGNLFECIMITWNCDKKKCICVCVCETGRSIQLKIVSDVESGLIPRVSKFMIAHLWLFAWISSLPGVPGFQQKVKRIQIGQMSIFHTFFCLVLSVPSLAIYFCAEALTNILFW